MTYIKITEDLPINGSFVYAKMKGKPEMLRLYKDDSFGLGDDDYLVTRWRYVFSETMTPDQVSQRCSPLSTSHTEGHTFAYS